MLVTEEEARKKLCPESMAAPAEYRPHDGMHIQAAGPHRCWASECMGWRWATPLVKAIAEGVLSPDDREKALLAWNTIAGGLGYCGKAGKPE